MDYGLPRPQAQVSLALPRGSDGPSLMSPFLRRVAVGPLVMLGGGVSGFPSPPVSKAPADLRSGAAVALCPSPAAWFAQASLTEIIQPQASLKDLAGPVEGLSPGSS